VFTFLCCQSVLKCAFPLHAHWDGYNLKTKQKEKMEMTAVGGNVVKLESSHIAGGNIKRCSPSGE